MLTSSATMVFLSYWTFAKAHGSQLAFLDSLMRARDDLDKADVTAIMESAKRKVKQENLSDVPEGGVTVIGRVEAAQHQGGLFNMNKLGLGKNADGSASTQAAAGWSALAASAHFLGQGWRAAHTNNSAIPPAPPSA
jgi:exocyst complex component 3